MHIIGRVSDRRWLDSLSMYYIDNESCHRLSEIPTTVHKICVKKTEWGRLFVLLVTFCVWSSFQPWFYISGIVIFDIFVYFALGDEQMFDVPDRKNYKDQT